MLSNASTRDVKRLLEMFPLPNLRAAWPDLKGTKDELCTAISETKDYERILRFIDEHISCCHQHIYVFTHGPELPGLPDTIPEGEKEFEAKDAYAVYLVRVRYSVFLKDPLEEASLEFLWPIRIELTKDHLIVRFSVLEPNPGSYFDRPYYVEGRSVDEQKILAATVSPQFCQYADLHKGVKSLWSTGFMDSEDAKFRKAYSKSSEEMDRGKGIREHYPELYEVIVDSPLFKTIFLIPENKNTTASAVIIDPSKGYISFPRYTEKKGDTDFVVREILRLNQ